MASLKLLKFLRPSCVITNMAATAKQEAIEELLLCLAREGLLDDTDKVRGDVLARERQMSTGLKDGLAIPHAKSEGAKALAIALGLKPEGLEFESLDGQPAKVIFLVVSRADRTGPHLQCLAEIAQFSANAEARGKLLEARSAEQALRALEAG